MKEFRVVWIACPHVQHVPKVMFVEATDKQDAEAIARDRIERTQGIEWLTIRSVEPAKPAPPSGLLALLEQLANYASEYRTVVSEDPRAAGLELDDADACLEELDDLLALAHAEIHGPPD